jgi:hypothetical protein
VFNIHNIHVWSDKNPHQVQERGFQVKCNVWTEIIGNRLIRPHILPLRLNGAAYLDFFQNVLNDLLNDVPLAVERDM